MISEDSSAIVATYRRCMSGEGFIDTFYQLFLASSDEVRIKFQFTDMVHQKLVLRESLLVLILFSENQDRNHAELLQLAERHDRNHAEIAPHLYELWLDTLCSAVAQHDPEFTPHVEQLWRRAMQPGIDLMISKY
ncbi:hypothetical protein Enr13x_69700 [Stieleria neptunia]|uniref:Globin n=1 Tax=Stieleria neptunia TaxID=2527979 RepID=A0A518I1U7_9BACT|nr:globin [Stieleria neptunia]QDV47061.1 hypothetical protein Enr13x_69700 [Stieleria neptunia]